MGAEMMTFLSRWFGAGAGAVAKSARNPAGLRLATDGDSDVAPRRVPDAFVAGQGARIYSL
ncbi:MAG TPA: hypothetical protein VFP52_06120, partial [Myxococcales bacterium]|nr:hypothetical protein [Myxococcales bacterium]